MRTINQIINRGRSLALVLALLLSSYAEPVRLEDAAQVPRTPVEAWQRAAAFHAMLENQIGTHDLISVHDTVEHIKACLSQLAALMPKQPAEHSDAVKQQVVTLKAAFEHVHEAADEGNQERSEEYLHAATELLPQIAQLLGVELAEISQNPGSVHNGPPPAGSPHSDVSVRFTASGGIAVGQRVSGYIELFSGSTRLTGADLEVMHTQKVHLLIIDQNLNDYHHEHPTEVAPGKWKFAFTPREGGRYVVFADVQPKTTQQEVYARTAIDVAGDAAALTTAVSRTASVDGYRFSIDLDPTVGIPIGRATMLNVRITGPSGEPVTDLEPIMGAFAHGVGFPTDLQSVMHVHPMGTEPNLETDRGGPELRFHLLPQQAGYYKFYVQVKIQGRQLFAGFGINCIDPEARDVVSAPSSTGMTTKLPVGWLRIGGAGADSTYAVGMDRATRHDGNNSAYIRSLKNVEEGFAGIMQKCAADRYVGKRIRFSAWMKVGAAPKGAHVWMRVDGYGEEVLQRDRMDDRPVRGSSDWHKYSVVLDVPPHATAIAYGFFLTETGTAWVSDPQFEVVGRDVPSTNKLPVKPDPNASLPREPVNLAFLENEPLLPRGGQPVTEVSSVQANRPHN